MKRLFLLRHAKASPEEPWIDDAERPLTPKGRSDAVRMGRFLRHEIYVPDVVLCSMAVRTRQTLDLLLPELQASPAVQYLDELYLAKSSAIIDIIRHAPETGSLMVVSHNPGLEECAHQLTHRPADRALRKAYDTMSDKYPTGALAVIDFAVARWTEVGPQSGELEMFVRPKDLRDEA